LNVSGYGHEVIEKHRPCLPSKFSLSLCPPTPSRVMKEENVSFPNTFILLIFSEYPWLEIPLFGVVLVSYTLILLGNSSIILLSVVEPRLQTPMYFFLDNLSVLDLIVTCTIVPQLLGNLWGPEKNIAYWGCITQVYIFS
jgi:olfactory receptor